MEKYETKNDCSPYIGNEFVCIRLRVRATIPACNNPFANDGATDSANNDTACAANNDTDCAAHNDIDTHCH